MSRDPNNPALEPMVALARDPATPADRIQSWFVHVPTMFPDRWMEVFVDSASRSSPEPLVSQLYRAMALHPNLPGHLYQHPILLNSYLPELSQNPGLPLAWLVNDPGVVESAFTAYTVRRTSEGHEKTSLLLRAAGEGLLRGQAPILRALDRFFADLDADLPPLPVAATASDAAVMRWKHAMGAWLDTTRTQDRGAPALVGHIYTALTHRSNSNKRHYDKYHTNAQWLIVVDVALADAKARGRGAGVITRYIELLYELSALTGNPVLPHLLQHVFPQKR